MTSNSTHTAWEHFTLHPDPFAIVKLGYGGYSVETRFGTVAFDWAYDGESHTVDYNVTVPFGSTATVIHDYALPYSGSYDGPRCTLKAITGVRSGERVSIPVYAEEGKAGPQVRTNVGPGFHTSRAEHSCPSPGASPAAW